MKKRKITMSIGIISFLVMFIIVCLVTFSVLSLASASSNVNFNEKSIEHKMNYYELCNQGEEYLKKIDDQLYINYQQSTSQADYFSSIQYIQKIDSNIHINNHTISFDLIKDKQKLHVEIEVIYPGQKLYNLKTWKIESSQDWNPDNGINVL